MDNLLRDVDQDVNSCAPIWQTPLSWISSIMALDIDGFTPQDSKWSVHAVAAPSGESQDSPEQA